MISLLMKILLKEELIIKEKLNKNYCIFLSNEIVYDL